MKIEFEDQDDERKVQSIRLNPNIDPIKRLNKLLKFSDDIFDSHFSDWKKYERTKKNINRLGNKMLQAYNRCGAGKPEKDKQDEKSNEEKSILEGFLYNLNYKSCFYTTIYYRYFKLDLAMILARR